MYAVNMSSSRVNEQKNLKITFSANFHFPSCHPYMFQCNLDRLLGIHSEEIASNGKITYFLAIKVNSRKV